MEKAKLVNEAVSHLQVLCHDISERRVGSRGNREATDYVKNYFERSGWWVREDSLSVMDWKTEGASLHGGKQTFEVFSSPYSLGCDVEGELLPIANPDDLENHTLENKIILLHGDIASEQIMPKNFIFYNPDEHRRIVHALETGRPKALICATGRNSATAGGSYPFSLFEDGDFDIPSVYMKDTEGEKLLSYSGQTVTLQSKAFRIPESAFNITGRKGDSFGRRIAVTAHIDAKIGTPGAIDNATGVTVLLLLAALLKDYSGPYRIELIPFNGEDYYAVPGQMKFIEQNADKFGEIMLNINIDGAGYKEGPSCFSLFDAPEELRRASDRVFRNHPEIVEGLPWYQGDHSLFLQNGIPAVAVSSDWFIRHMECQDITHTPKDNLTIVDYERVAECAVGIKELIDNLL